MNQDKNEIEKITPEEQAPEQETPVPAQETPADMQENSEQTAPDEETNDSEKTEVELSDSKIPEKEEKIKTHRAKAYFSSNKFRRGSISTAFSAGFIVIVILINVIVGILGEKFPSINVDMTKNSTNTLSAQAIKVVEGVKTPVTISILATEAQTKGDQIFSDYGVKYSQVGILAAKMSEMNTNIKVEYIDLVKSPTFAANYKNDNITEGDVVIKSDKRYRVITATELFSMQTGSDGSSTELYSLVDSALASGVSSVTAETLPVAAFDTGHSEALDSTVYKSLLTNNSFEAKDFNLLTDAIPDKAQLIILGCPTTDYTDSEIKKLDDFLSNTKLAADRSLLLTFHPSQKEMPKLATFLKEWGIAVPQAVVVESDQSKYYTSDPSYILSNLQSGLSLGGSSDYGLFTTPQSTPINILYATQGSKTTYSLAKSNETCYLVDNNTKSTDTQKKQAYDTAVLTQDTVKSGDNTYKANVIALGSTTMFSEQILAANTFGNGKYAVDLAKYATGTSNTQTAVTSTPVQTNVSDITLSTALSTFLGLGVFTILIPLMIAVAGLLVYNKRRHL